MKTFQNNIQKKLSKALFLVLFLISATTITSCSILPILLDPYSYPSSGSSGTYHKCWGCSGTGYIKTTDIFGNKLKCTYCNGTGWKKY